MFSARVMDRFLNPRRVGPLEEATHFGVGGTPGEGPYARLWLRADGDKIVQATYESNPCPAATACASLAAELVEGRTLERAGKVEPRDLIALLGGVPEGKEECADRAVTALRNALAHGDRSNGVHNR